MEQDTFTFHLHRISSKAVVGIDVTPTSHAWPDASGDALLLRNGPSNDQASLRQELETRMPKCALPFTGTG